MSFSKVFGAGLLTLAIVGGSATYLSHTLHAVPAKVAVDGYVTEQPAPTQRHAEVIVTEGQAS